MMSLTTVSLALSYNGTCGEKINVEELELLPHSWGEWTVETEEPTLLDEITAFFESIADFFSDIIEWFANLFKF